MDPALSHRPNPLGTFRRNFLRSLDHRDFRLFFTAQAVSILGTWMHNVAQAWLVYRLTDSGLMLGLTSFFALVPILMGSLFGGALADRSSRYHLSIITHYAATVLVGILTMLTLTGAVRTWQVMFLAFLVGVTHAVGMPARHALVAQLVPKNDLPNAIALHSFAFNVARFIGPAVAGYVVVVSGEGAVFLVNALTYVFFIVVMHAITPPQPENPASDKDASMLAQIGQALRWAWTSEEIRAALLLAGLVSLAGTSSLVLMPIFADHIFHGGPDELGLMLGSTGAGSLLGALLLAYWTDQDCLERLVGSLAVAAGIALAALPLVNDLGSALPLLAIIGFGMASATTGSNTLIQLKVDNDHRGRLMALFSLVVVGLSPLGSLAVGILAEVGGPRFGVGVCGTILGLGSVAYLRLRMGAG